MLHQEIYLRKGGSFLSVVVINLAIALLIGSRVVWVAVFPLSEEPMAYVKVKPVPPPPKSPAQAGGAGAKSLLNPDALVFPPPSAPSVISSASSLSASFASPSMGSAMSLQSISPPSGAGLLTGTSGPKPPSASLYGDAATPGSDGLMGELYDLKQTPDGTPTPMAIVPPEPTDDRHMAKGWQGIPATKEAIKVLKQYVHSNWDPSILDQYYKAPMELEASQLFIPTRPSPEATKAFHVETKVAARRWVVHYQATVIPPQTGKFRFCGFGDDFLVVRVNGVNVLDGSWPLNVICPEANSPHEKTSIPGTLKDTSGRPLMCGKWINLQSAIPTSLDILIGENPGGQSGFVLLIEPENDPSPAGDWPVFQIASVPVPNLGSGFSGKTMVFGVQ